MERLYKDYINIDKDFIPVFNKHWDKEQPERWKSFYPHDSFKSILSQMADTLEMSSNEKRKPIWMNGAYGTGKTFASFAIKHIIEDSSESIEPYFETNNMMSLYSRFAGIKNKGDILVVHRSGSSSVLGDNKLFSEVQSAIKAALREKGYSYLGIKSQYDVVLEKLNDPYGAFNFSGIFNKYKGEFTEYSSPEKVIKDLEELDLDGQVDVLERIIEVAEKEGYNWSLSQDDIINWIDDIITGNKLYAIVFIWDEFTEYFKNNQGRITGLQEGLATISATKPFFLFLITHSNVNQLIFDNNSRKIIEARFKMSTIEMADTTAFMLMKQAIKINGELKNDWSNKQLDLWTRVEKTANSTIIKHSDDIKAEELKALIPMHPYAAYLLKVISASISSNQRTMFQFLNGDVIDGDQVRKNFRWFIENFSNEYNGWNYLTSDYIWDYFFTFDNVDLDESSKGIMSHYSTFENLCKDEDEKRVLKVTLLLSAMQQKMGASRSHGMLSLLRPTLTNISSCFSGTKIGSSISFILQSFVSKGIFGEINEGISDKLYVTQAKTINQERFDSLKTETLQMVTFDKLLNTSEYNIYERFMPTGFTGSRYETIAISPNDYRNPVMKVMGSATPINKIPLIYIFARNESDKTKVSGVIEKISSEYSRDAVIVDFTSQALTDEVFDNIIELKTKERYFLGDSNQVNLCKTNVKHMINEWKNKLDITTLRVFLNRKLVVSCQGGMGLRAKLKDIDLSLFPYGLENITENDKVFAVSGFKETVAIMGMNKLAMPANYRYLNAIASKLTDDHIWNVTSYEKTNPSHSVSQMKLAIDKVIEEGFKKNSMVAIKDIWDVLQQKPFGLLNCTGSVFLMGFLLKDYADSNYYKSDKINTVNLTHDGLGDIIYGAVKGLVKAENQFIVKTTAEQVDFCKKTGKIFKIAADKQNSISDIVKNIKTFLINNEYPLWPLSYYVKEDEDKGLTDSTIKIIDFYCELVSSEKMAGRDENKIAEDIYSLYMKEAGICEYLENIMQVQNMKSGLHIYVAENNPVLIALARELGVSADEYLKSLKDKITDAGSYLWNKGDIDKQITNVFDELRFISSLNKILVDKKKTLNDAVNAITNKLSLIKLPYPVIKDKFPYLGNIIKIFMEFKDNVVNKIETIKEIEVNGDKLNKFYDDQLSIFSNVIEERLKAKLSQDELENLYNKVEYNMLNKSADIFWQVVNQELEKYKKTKKINMLFKKWQDITGTTSPIEWSRKNEIPILCLFGDDTVKAQNVFAIVNRTRSAAHENEIDDAIAYLESGKLNLLKKVDECNDIFRRHFAGLYEYIIKDQQELKLLIKQKVGGEPYDWFALKPSIDNHVNEFARNKYSSEYYDKVLMKINNLSPESAKEYLKQLIKDKPVVGINILKE